MFLLKMETKLIFEREEKLCDKHPDSPMFKVIVIKKGEEKEYKNLNGCLEEIFTQNFINRLMAEIL